jgi:CubicO group peptidase (beta-lactamase class C family)
MAARLPHRLARLCVVAAVIVATAGCSGGSPAAPTTSGPAASATSVSAHPVVPAEVEKRIQEFLDLDYTGGFDQVRAIVVSVAGRPVFEHYYHSSAATTGNVFSVTKSVMSMLVGIAIDERKLRGVDQTLAELLPAYAAAMSPAVKAVTLRQVLTMTAGLPPDPPDLPAFVTSSDWVGSILAEGTRQPAGQGFAYSSAGSHLLSAILRQATGRSTLDYAREKLFTPLGISTVPAAEPVAREESRPTYESARFAWPTDPQGNHVGFSFLKLTARDMARLGQLWLNQGRWAGRQLVSAGWVTESTTAHVDTHSTPEQYSYQWWVTSADGHRAYAAIGYGGQLIEVVPDLDLVAVVASTDAPGAAGAQVYLDLVSSYVAPAIGR